MDKNMQLIHDGLKKLAQNIADFHEQVSDESAKDARIAELEAIVGNQQQSEDRYQLLMDLWTDQVFDSFDGDQQRVLVAWAKAWHEARGKSRNNAQ